MTRTEQTALQKAVAFLSRREHSRDELYWKLRSHDYAEEEIAAALQRLCDKGMQSDSRFAEAYVQSRLQRGHGPYKLMAELKQRGVEEALAHQLVYSDEIDWYEIARRVLVKKYGNHEAADYASRVKRMRFLQQKGFSSEQIHYAMESADAIG